MANILVIDDDDLVSRTLQRALKMYDHQVMTASSGIEGLQLARRHRPDLFILDIMMPGIDGYRYAAKSAATLCCAICRFCS